MTDPAHFPAWRCPNCPNPIPREHATAHALQPGHSCTPILAGWAAALPQPHRRLEPTRPALF